MSRLAAIVLVAFALAGCGNGGSSNDESASSGTAPGTTSTTPGSPPPMQTVPDCMPPPDASTSPQKSASDENRETMYLTDVSLGSDKCSAKVIFQLEQQAPGPGYQVSYEPAATAKIEDASGKPVEIAGEAFLVVKLTPAMTAKIDGDRVTKTYTGPRRLPGTGPISEVVKTGDFEGVVTWVIGLDSKRPFTTKASDAQLVVQIDMS
jgi:hypothetical protein